jgi:hypothetical protein
VVRILDIYGNAASVRVQAATWVDYLHVAKSKRAMGDRQRALGARAAAGGRIAVTPWRRVWRRD